MILLLLLRQLLVLLVLLRDQLGLLLLVLLIGLRVAGGDGYRRLVRLKVAGMVRRSGPRRRNRAVSRRMIRRSGFPGGDGARSRELSRPGRCSDGRLAVIRRSAQLRIGPRSLDMLHLRGYGRNMALVRPRFFLRSRPRRDATFSTVITNAIYRRPVDHRSVVNVMSEGDVHIGHIAIVVKLPALPPSPFKTVTVVAETIINSAVEPHMRTPVTLMKEKSAATPTPISGVPQVADLRDLYPGARHPVIIAVIGVPGPVSGRPLPTVGGANRLLINRYRRRTEGDGYTDLRECCSRRDEHRQHG